MAKKPLIKKDIKSIILKANEIKTFKNQIILIKAKILNLKKDIKT